MNKDTNPDFQSIIPTRISSKTPKKKININRYNSTEFVNNRKLEKILPPYISASQQSYLNGSQNSTTSSASKISNNTTDNRYENDYARYKINNKIPEYNEPAPYKKGSYSESRFNPYDSPINIPEKPNNKIDITRNRFFKHSNSSTDSQSSTGSTGHSSKNGLIKNARNSINLAKKKSNTNIRKMYNSNSNHDNDNNYNINSSPKNSQDDYTVDQQSNTRNNPSVPPVPPLPNHIASKKGETITENSELKRIDTTLSDGSSKQLKSFMISPAKDEKLSFHFSSPKMETYNIENTSNIISTNKNNYDTYDDNDGCFVYNTHTSYNDYDFTEYRNLLRLKTFEESDSASPSEDDKKNSYPIVFNSRKDSLNQSSSNKNSNSTNYENKSASRKQDPKSKLNYDYPLTPIESDVESIRHPSLTRSRRNTRDSGHSSTRSHSLPRTKKERDSEIESLKSRSLSYSSRKGSSSEFESFRSLSLSLPGRSSKRESEFDSSSRSRSLSRSRKASSSEVESFRSHSLPRTGRNSKRESELDSNRSRSLSRSRLSKRESEIENTRSSSLSRPRRDYREDNFENIRKRSLSRNRNNNYKENWEALFERPGIGRKDSREMLRIGS